MLINLIETDLYLYVIYNKILLCINPIQKTVILVVLDFAYQNEYGNTKCLVGNAKMVFFLGELLVFYQKINKINRNWLIFCGKVSFYNIKN